MTTFKFTAHTHTPDGPRDDRGALRVSHLTYRMSRVFRGPKTPLRLSDSPGGLQDSGECLQSGLWFITEKGRR